MKLTRPTKKVRLTVEWEGMADEYSWSRCCAKMIEEGYTSGITRVSKVELLTDLGTTAPLSKREVWRMRGVRLVRRLRRQVVAVAEG